MYLKVVVGGNMFLHQQDSRYISHQCPLTVSSTDESINAHSLKDDYTVHVINTFLNITEVVRTNSKEKFPENQLGGIARLTFWSQVYNKTIHPAVVAWQYPKDPLHEWYVFHTTYSGRIYKL